MVCREDVVSDFDKRRAAVGRLGSRDAFLYAFDLLEIDGEDLRAYEWHVRRAMLRSLLKRAGPGIRLSEYPAALFPNAPFAKLDTLTPVKPSATVPVTYN